MDRGVQIGYEHQVPKVPSYGSRRVVAIPREGQPRFKAEGADTWVRRTRPLEFTGTVGLRKERRAVRQKIAKSTRAKAFIIAGSTCVQRRAGTTKRNEGSVVRLERGAESVVVSRCSSKMREADGVSCCGTRQLESRVRPLYGAILLVMASPFGCFAPPSWRKLRGRLLC